MWNRSLVALMRYTLECILKKHEFGKTNTGVRRQKKHWYKEYFSEFCKKKGHKMDYLVGINVCAESSYMEKKNLFLIHSGAWDHVIYRILLDVLRPKRTEQMKRTQKL
jgi:hypothetical protein